MSEESNTAGDSQPEVNGAEDKSREAKYMGVVVALMFLVFVLYSMAASYADYKKATVSEDWPKTPVIKADPRVWHSAPSRHDPSGHWNYYIYYQYEVAGHSYRRWTQTTEGRDEEGIKAASDQAAKRLASGGQVSYNPGDPDDSTVERTADNAGAPLMFVFFYALFLPIPVWLIWWSNQIKPKSAS